MKEVALRTSGEHRTELEPTPTENTVTFRAADFSTLCEALDYAALGQTGGNFYGSRGDLSAVLSYADLREQALSLARKRRIQISTACFSLASMPVWCQCRFRRRPS